MLQPFYSAKSFGHRHILPAAIALALSGVMLSEAQAARVGHARVVSAAGEPLQVLIPFLELTAEDLATLQVSLADEQAWQRAGLQAPVSLGSLSLRVEAGPNPTTRYLRVKSSEVLKSATVDLLFNMGSSTAQRQVQISFLSPAGNKALNVAPAELASAKSSKTAANNVASVIVREGDTLFDIAGRYSVENATRYQMLAALLHTNPQAFIQENMNLLKAGAELSLPDSDQVLSEDPERARQLYKQQAQAYAEYRGRLGAQVAAGDSIQTGRHATKGKVTDAPGTSSAGQAAPAQDRVRLSTDKNTEAKDDARASEAKALKEAEGRVATLQSNVEALNQLANKPSATAEKPATGPDSTTKAGVEAAKGDAQTSAQDGAAGSSLPSSPTVSSPKPDSTQDKPLRNMAKDETDADWTSSLPAWLVDNLLVFVTAALALIAFIFAWLLRRSGARRQDEEDAYSEDDAYDNEEYGYDDYESDDDRPVLDEALLNRKLDDINLDLDQAPNDEPRRGQPRD